MASTSAQPEENSTQLKGIVEKAENLIRGRCVGKGRSGIVYELTTQWLGKRCVIKDFPAVKSAVFRIKPLVDLVEHKNIVQYYWWTVDKSTCSIVLEYVDDDLGSVVQKKREAQWKKTLAASGTSSNKSHLVDIEKFLKPQNITIPDGVERPSSETLVIDSTPFELLDAIEIMFQIATGMEYLHGQDVPHGDLKPNKVLVSFTADQRMHVKVTDYGLLGIKKSMKMASKHTRQSEVLLWKAPELFEKFLGPSTEDSGDPWTDSDTESDEEMPHAPNSYDIFKEKKADVYSFAVLCSLILGGELSYPNLSSSDLRKQTSSDNLRPKLPSTCPKLLRTLIETSWDSDYAARLDFSEICGMLNSIKSQQMRGTPETQKQYRCQLNTKTISRPTFNAQTSVPKVVLVPPESLQVGHSTSSPFRAMNIDKNFGRKSSSLFAPILHERYIFDIIETTIQAALNVCVNKCQCKRLGERFEVVRESLMADLGPGETKLLERIDKIGDTLRYNIRTMVKRGRALVIRYQDAATIVTSVINWRCNREAFKEIHKEIDNLKGELDLETFYAHKPGSFELVSGEEREKVLERDAEEDKKMMLQGLKDLHINGLDLTTLELVVDEKPQGEDYWPSYLVIEASKIQRTAIQHHRPLESISDADKHLEVVYRGKWLNCDFDLKQFKSSELDCNMEQMRREVDSLIKLRHPHLIQLVGFAHDEHNCYVLMELMETDLRHLLNCRKCFYSFSIMHHPFSFHETLNIIHQIAKGMLFLHKQGYVHGELKCSNILIKESDGIFDVKIANFHCFRHLGKKSTTKNIESHQFAWSAPEASSDYKIINGEPTDFLLQKGDVYSFGMTCYEIMTGNLPFQDASGRELVENIKRYFRPEDMPIDARDNLVAIVKICWDPIPENRPDFDTICRFLCVKWQATDFGGRKSASASPDFLNGWMMHKEPEVMHKQKQQRVSIHIANKWNFPQYLRIDPMHLEPEGSTGKESSSEVFKVQWLGCTFAAKQLQSTTNIQSMQEELQFLMELLHPNIVRLVGFSQNVESDRCAIVMENIETNLTKLIHSRTRLRFRSPFPIPQTWAIIAQISRGMSYLHSHGIVHRDLKPSKVLVKFDGVHMRIKIAYFGNLSQYISEPPTRDVDTSIWRAPEVLQGSTAKAQPHITQASDVYSFGMVCYAVLTGKHVSNEGMEYFGVQNRNGSIDAGLGMELPQEHSCCELLDLMRRCLHQNPDERPSFRSIWKELASKYSREFLKHPRSYDYIQFTRSIRPSYPDSAGDISPDSPSGKKVKLSSSGKSKV